MRQAVVGLALSLLMLNAASAGGTLYAVNWNDHALISIDPESLAVTTVGSLGILTDAYGDLAYDETNGTMYWVHGGAGNDLYTIDLTTGAATLVGSHGIEHLYALGSVSGRVYGQDWAGNVFEFDTTTAAPTFLGRNYIFPGGYDWNPVTEQMILLADGGWIWSIDETGAATPLSAGEFIAADCDIAYDIDRSLYWVGAFYNGEVYQYDASWNRTLVLETFVHLSGIEYVPGAGPTVPAPGALLLANTGLLSLVRLRRRLAA